MGEKGGQARTPEWAAKECDLPVHTIYALARQWAAKKTMLAVGTIHGATGAARAAYGTEWARLCVLLMAMQGMGKPGVNCWGGAASGPPLNFEFNFPGYSQNGWDPFGLVAEKSYFPHGKHRDAEMLPAVVCPRPYSIRRSPGQAKGSAGKTSSSSSTASPALNPDRTAPRLK